LILTLEEAIAAFHTAGLVADIREGKVVIRGGRSAFDLEGIIHGYRSPFLILQEGALYRGCICWKGHAVQENFGGLDFLVKWICKKYET
jgi:hypothetical protein